MVNGSATSNRSGFRNSGNHSWNSRNCEDTGMSDHFIYRDGDEVEVSWLEWKLDNLRRSAVDLWRGFRDTDWLHYFCENGHGDVTFKEFSGFRKCQNVVAVLGQWTICIKGGRRRYLGECYYRSVMLRDPESIICAVHGEACWSDYVKNRVAMAEAVVDRYAYPNCTCRVGFHRRCPHHFRTRD